MTLTYQQQYVLDGLAARAAILNLNARYNRLYSAGDMIGWLATFRHSGATYTRGGQSFTDLSAAFDGGDGQRLITVDHDVTVDGIEASQQCVALLLHGNVIRSTGSYTDRLVYERGGWYFTSRDLVWDAVPRESALPV
ncbi:nuclear transport factor 2 family protein [Mycobacterium sp. IDR2000157661]|uniref:nuclear transport factor 2 family protein n=1 Tax=Mycobacterium sp. IDR2000157661 TaxID=2867005 RepID=UPI001EEB8C64|nr:nuclear transport factor 2 family protein [Mycobacterium sp. IDR2000157661]ULE32489.1 nuclear transport factor 2 family protein [Mycobacterium sp. IDR2000157661]